jgi:hypothetical protein
MCESPDSAGIGASYGRLRRQTSADRAAKTCALRQKSTSVPTGPAKGQREIPLRRLREHDRRPGEIGDIMSEIAAYGTAVTVEPIEASALGNISGA